MRSAAARSREETALGSQAMLQGLQIEVATIDSNPLGCFAWEQGAASRRLAGLRYRFHNRLPLVFIIPDLFPCITNPVTVLAFLQGGSVVGHDPTIRFHR